MMQTHVVGNWIGNLVPWGESMLTSMNIRVTVEHGGNDEEAVRAAVLREFQEMVRRGNPFTVTVDELPIYVQAVEPLKADDSLRDQLPRVVVEMVLLYLGRPGYPEVTHTVVADLVRGIDPGATVSMIEEATATVLRAFDPANAQNALSALWGTVGGSPNEVVAITPVST